MFFLFQSPLTLETPNQVSLGQLWLELLKFYTLEFALEEYVICVRIKDILTRENKNWPKRRIAIEGMIYFIWRIIFVCHSSSVSNSVLSILPHWLCSTILFSYILYKFFVKSVIVYRINIHLNIPNLSILDWLGILAYFTYLYLIFNYKKFQK